MAQVWFGMSGVCLCSPHPAAVWANSEFVWFTYTARGCITTGPVRSPAPSASSSWPREPGLVVARARDGMPDARVNPDGPAYPLARVAGKTPGSDRRHPAGPGGRPSAGG
jgi:hypothetical protein